MTTTLTILEELKSNLYSTKHDIDRYIDIVNDVIENLESKTESKHNLYKELFEIYGVPNVEIPARQIAPKKRGVYNAIKLYDLADLRQEQQWKKIEHVGLIPTRNMLE